MSMKTPPPQAYTRDTLVEAFNWLQNQPESVREIAKTSDVMVSLYLRAKRYGETGKIEDEAPVSGKTFRSDLKNLAEGLKAFDGASELTSSSDSLIHRTNTTATVHAPQSTAPLAHHSPAPLSTHSTAAHVPHNTAQLATQSSAPVASHATPQVPPQSQSAHSSAHMPGQTQGNYTNYSGSSQNSALFQTSQNHRTESNFSHSAPYPQGSQPGYPPGISGFEPSSRTHRPSVVSELDPRSRSLVTQVMQQLNLSSEHEALRLLISLGAQKITRSLE